MGQDLMCAPLGLSVRFSISAIVSLCVDHVGLDMLATTMLVDGLSRTGTASLK